MYILIGAAIFVLSILSEASRRRAEHPLDPEYLFISKEGEKKQES